MLDLICNILWFVVAGFWMGLSWWAFGLLCFISIVGIPWGRACFVIGEFAFWPFGRVPIARNVLYGSGDIGTGTPGLIGNIIWLFFCGIWICIEHLAWALCLALTIVGIPFAWQLVKLAALSICPIGKAIVPVKVADEAQEAYAARFGYLPATYLPPWTSQKNDRKN